MYSAYLFDLDGTIYRGAEAIPGAADVVAELRRRGAIIRYLTNNSSQTREAFVAKLTGMGFDTTVDEVIGSAYGTACYCQTEGISSAFVVGEAGLAQTLEEAGIAVTDDPRPDAVVAGICRQFDYALMNEAMQRIRRGTRFIATNRDTTFPLENDVLAPGAGSIVAAIEACSGAKPFVVGKPNPFLVELVLHQVGLEPSDALVVGDRYDTDILCGRAAGCPTFMVLTGVAKSAPEGQWHGASLSDLL